MSFNSILVIVVMVALFAAMIGFITKEGGWQNGGCNGDCGSCGSRCAHPTDKDGTSDTHQNQDKD